MTDKITHNIDKMVKTKKDDRLYTIHNLDLDYDANHIYLVGREEYIEDGNEPGVEFAMANRFIKNINILMRKSQEPILIHLKSCGGIWQEGMAIHNMIKACPNKITILVYTHARSMSSLILQAADKRVMMPDSTFMFHDGTQAMEGTYKQFMTEATEAEKARERMLDIYIKSLKNKGKFQRKSVKFIRNWIIEQMNLKEEVYLNANDAVLYGFADEVFGSNGIYNWESLLKF